MDHRTYWKIKRRRIALLLAIWFVAGPLMSILFIEELNQIVILGTPVGFWMAQQGSILVFVILIFVYAVWAGRLDRRAGVAEGPPSEEAPPPEH
jgi:putative solute:sodium symporter small subunit